MGLPGQGHRAVYGVVFVLGPISPWDACIQLTFFGMSLAVLQSDGLFLPLMNSDSGSVDVVTSGGSSLPSCEERPFYPFRSHAVAPSNLGVQGFLYLYDGDPIFHGVDTGKVTLFMWEPLLRGPRKGTFAQPLWVEPRGQQVLSACWLFFLCLFTGNFSRVLELALLVCDRNRSLPLPYDMCREICDSHRNYLSLGSSLANAL